MTDDERFTPLPPKLVRRNRWLLIGLMLLSLLPLGAALWLYFGAPGLVQGAQTNQGALLTPPADLAALELERADGSTLDVGEVRRWRLLVFPGNDCSAECLEGLRLLRQVHVLLGRDDDRVERFVVHYPNAPAAQVEVIDEALPDMQSLQGSAKLLAEALSGRQLRGPAVKEDFDPEAVQQGVLTVDPLGNVVFYHRLGQIGDPLLSDLKRLLRLSNIG